MGTITVTVTEKFMEAGNLENYDLSNYVITQIAVQTTAKNPLKLLRAILPLKQLWRYGEKHYGIR